MVLLSVVFVACWFFLHGYEFGSVDHALHLVFLRHEVDPAFLANDPFLSVTARHFSLFWVLQAPLVRVIDLRVLYFIIHVVSVWAMLAGTRALHQALFPDKHTRSTTLLALAFSVFSAQSTFASIPAFDPFMLNRTVVLGAELYALAFAIRGRFVHAFLIAGLAFNLHATTAVHCAALIGLLALFHPSRRRSALGSLAFLVGAAPLLGTMALHAASHPMQASTSVGSDATWRTAVEAHYPFHHFVKCMDLTQWTRLALPVTIIIAAWRRWRSRELLILTGGTLAIVAAAAVAIDVLGIVRLVPAHLHEVTRFLSYLAYACAGMLLAEALAARRTWMVAALVVYALDEANWIAYLIPGLPTSGGTMLIQPATTLLVIAYLALGPAKPVACDRSVDPWLLGSIVLTLSLLAVPLRVKPVFVWGPAQTLTHGCEFRYGDAPAEPGDEICGFAAMRFVKSSTPKDAVFVVPPVMLHPFSMFRYYAERAVVTTLKDGGEATFDRAYAADWLERVNAVAGVPYEDTASPCCWTTWVHNIERVNAGYLAADRARFLALRARYGATHAIVAHRVDPGLPIVYEDAGFKVVRIE